MDLNLMQTFVVLHSRDFFNLLSIYPQIESAQLLYRDQASKINDTPHKVPD